MKKSIVSLLLLGFILFGCSNPVNVGPDLTPGIDSKSMVTSRAWTQVDGLITGELGPGASYYIYIPENWNNKEDDLVLYVHGYVFPPELKDILPEPFQWILPTPHIDDELRNGLLAAGYAVAYSTFSEYGDGYALKEGAIRTRQLRGIFTSKVGKPAHIYLVGYSLGGAISLMLAEKNPNLFSGALLVSGFVGGGQMQIDYVANAYLLLYHYLTEPGDTEPIPILPHILDIPEEFEDLTVLALKVLSALNPSTIAQLSSVRVKAYDDPGLGIPVFQVRNGAGDMEIVEAILSPLLFGLLGTNDILDRTHGNVMFDNTETQYLSPLDPSIDTKVERFTSTPDAENYLKHWYEPTGKLKIPVLTLHNEYDAIVPSYQEAAYEVKVSDARNSDMLEQWPGAEPFGHCNFSPDEIGTALLYLKTWVEGL